MIGRIIPKQANNNYLGSPIAFYGMILFMLLMTFSAYMHFLQPQYAANEIGNIIVLKLGNICRLMNDQDNSTHDAGIANTRWQADVNFCIITWHFLHVVYFDTKFCLLTFA